MFQNIFVNFKLNAQAQTKTTHVSNNYIPHITELPCSRKRFGRLSAYSEVLIVLHMRHNYNLGGISNDDIFEHVKLTVESYRREITLLQFNENIVDPIKLTFDSKVYGKTIHQAIEDECFRQIDKSNANRIGYFHQNLFRYAGNGWTVPSQGFDVENDERHIYVELKNKHNTMNSASSQKTYMKMQAKLLDDDQATCYLVEAISTKSKDNTWRITLDKNRVLIIAFVGCQWISFMNLSLMIQRLFISYA